LGDSPKRKSLLFMLRDPFISSLEEVEDKDGG
jgi:hypothetical protein